MIANCGCDERGLYSGGQAGDQSGREWHLCEWYSYPWNCVLHHPDPLVRQTMAKLAIQGAQNDHIGYDQSQRETFYIQLQASGWYPANITVNCEADCSSGVAAIVRATGYILGRSELLNVGYSAVTWTLRTQLMAAGFEFRNGAKYLNSDDYICAGDILLNEGNHTTINVTDGRYADKTNPDKYVTLKLRCVVHGDYGQDVYFLQCLLKARGMYDGDLDGIYGDLTTKAVELYQTKAGLKVDGECGINTWTDLLQLEYLGMENQYYLFALKQTEKGTDKTDSTLVIQCLLKVFGYYEGHLDGDFGPLTEKAVKAFQKDNPPLAVDGVCGVLTIAVLISF